MPDIHWGILSYIITHSKYFHAQICIILGSTASIITTISETSTTIDKTSTATMKTVTVTTVTVTTVTVTTVTVTTVTAVTVTVTAGHCSSDVDHSFIGDGYCDDVLNNLDCGFDEGDCCLNNTITLFCTICKCYDDTPKEYDSCMVDAVPLIGDGYCDDYLNNPHCGFDEGDCCLNDTIFTMFCTTCMCFDEVPHGK